MTATGLEPGFTRPQRDALTNLTMQSAILFGHRSSMSHGEGSAFDKRMAWFHGVEHGTRSAVFSLKKVFETLTRLCPASSPVFMVRYSLVG